MSSEQEALFELLLQRESIDLSPAPAVKRRSGGPEAPLSFAQSRLWFLNCLDGPSANYNMPGVLRLNGALETEALRLSLEEIRNRHETLRTRFVSRGGEPVQVIDPPGHFALPVADLVDMDEDERAACLQHLASQNAILPFDLSQGPLLRAELVRLSAHQHVLLFAMHHIIADGWSVGILIHELTIEYRARQLGRTPELPDLAVQYADYAEWQRTHQNRQSLETALSYWRNRLAGAPDVVSLPIDRPRPPVQTFSGRTHRFHIGSDLTARLRSLGRTSNATLFMILQAGFAALLSRYNGSEDIVFGTPVANRGMAELEPLIGFFANTLVLRTDLSGEPTFEELIARIRIASLGDLDHQDLPFELLVEALQPQRNLTYAPVIQVLLVLQNTPRYELQLPGLTVLIEEAESHVAKFDLTVSLTETATGLAGEIEYSTDLFDSATITRMAGHLENIFDAMARRPDVKVCDVDFLSVAEVELLLTTWNATESDFPRDKCVQHLFDEQAAATPDAIALMFRDQNMTYADLNGRANQLARHLRALGVGPDVAVPIICERSIEFVVGILGIIKAGGAYVPLDPKYPADRLEYMFGEVNGPVVLTHRTCNHRVPTGTVRLLLDEDWPIIARERNDNLDHHTRPDNLANVIFTSGSTGRPKGVRVVHHGVVRLVRNTNYADLSADEVILQLTPISFDVSTFEIWAALLNGGRLVVPPPGMLSFAEIGRCIKDYGVTTMWLTSGLFHLMVEENLEGLRPLRQLLAGGDVLSVRHCRRVLREIPGLRLINGYGPTENTSFTTCCTLTEQTISHSVSIGTPISNTQAYILDRHRKLVPPGCPGELYAAGYGLARDYLNAPQLTAEKFVPNPFDNRPGARLYRIGDLCRYLPDGNIQYLGRSDLQVKIRGFRIELGEIETVITSFDAIRDCTVTTRPDPNGDKQLVAYVVATTPDDSMDVTELQSALGKRLPEFMLPSAIVVLDSLPLNPNGKVDREALPDPQVFCGHNAHTAATTPTEIALADIWSRLLHASRVGIHDNFFAAGGNSLMAIQMVSRIRDRLDAELPVRQVFESPTIAGLAQHLDTRPGRESRSALLPRMTPLPRDHAPPLSFAQQRLWFLYQMDPGSAAYNVPIKLRISGRLRIDLLQRCFEEILRRHEALRTNFLEQDGSAVQVIHAQRSLNLQSHDLRALPPDEREAEWPRLAQGEDHRPFDLKNDMLLRLLLLRLADNDHILQITLHHIVCDGWSLGVLIDEVSALYRCFAHGRPSPLTELRVQYADFAAWQRSWLRDGVQQQLAYWRPQLSGAPTLLELPTDRPRPAVQTYPGRTYLFEVESDLMDRLNALNRQCNTSLFMALLATYAGILSRYSGQHDVVVGSPVANRKHSDTEALIGFFINTLALRIDLSGDPTFRDLLARVRQVTLDAFAHDDMPLEQLVEELQPQRTLSHSPIFQTLFVLQNAPMRDLDLPGLKLTMIHQTSRIAKFDLTLTLEEVDGGLQGEFEYNTDLFDPDTIARLATHFKLLLSDATVRPDERVSRMQILAGAERQRLLTEWSRGEASDGEPSVISIPRWFEAQAARTPDAPAVVFSDQSLTYRALNARSNQLARFLFGRGITADARVGLCLERGFEMVIAQLGVLKAGGAYVPLDPDYPDERLAFMMRDSRISLLLTERKWLTSHPPDALEAVCLDADWSLIAGESDANLPASPAPDDLAYLMYTSGSTGQPKGVMIEHRALVNHMRWMQRRFAVTAADRVLQKTPFSFDASVWEFYLPLLTGGVLVLARPDGHSDSEYLVEAIRGHDVTILQGVPSLLRMLVETAGFREANSLRYIFSGGEPLTVDLRDKLLHASRATLCNLYGPTEACIDATFYVCNRNETGSFGLVAVPIGRPIQNAMVYVMDDQRQLVPAGVPGELFLGGTPLARGYWNQPALTAGRFVENPFGPGRLYRTGDRVRLRQDGNLEFLGRADDQVKLRGFRIELGEVEAVLRKHPTVHDVTIIVAGDRPNDQRLVAFVQGGAGHSVSINELRLLLKEQLPAYMIPTAWAVLDQLPRLPNGKVNRAALVQAEVISQATDNWPALMTGTEQLLVAIWTDLIDHHPISRNDNFFELGGHSLLATQLASRIRQAFSMEMPLRRIFEAPTVTALADVIDAEIRAQRRLSPLPAILPVSRDVPLPLSFAQERLWFLSQLEEDNPFYNMPVTLELTGDLHVVALGDALTEVVRRHQSLRTSLISVNGKSRQIIAAVTPIVLDVADLTGVAAHAQADEVRRRAEAEALRPFDLSKDLLLRAQLLSLAERRHVLLLTLHHIASDGWSMGILVDELTRLYTALAAGLPSPLPELPIQYADFAAWQRQHLASDLQQVQMDYWRQQLAGAPSVLELPNDHRRPGVHTFRGGQTTFRLDTELSTALRSLSRRVDGTLFMTLFAGFAALLSRYTGQTDILVGSPIANRNRREIEPLIGFFVNILALRVDLSDDPSVEALLRQVRHTTLDAYAHQDLPFEQLVEQLQPGRDMTRNPLVQVSFAMQNTPMPALQVAGLTLMPLAFDAQTVRFDLEFHLWDSKDGIDGYLLYYRDIFEPATIERLLGLFEALLRAMATQPELPVSRLPLLTPDQRRQLLDEWAGTNAHRDQAHVCLHHWFERQAQQTPDAVAVIMPAGGEADQRFAQRQTMTYRQLDRSANQLAHHLRAHGAGPDVLVGLFMGRSIQTIVGLLAVLKAGAAYLPLDPDYPADRLAFMLEDSKVRLVVTDDSNRDALPSTEANVISVGADSLAQFPDDRPLTLVRPDHLAYVIYTSGSTGQPKGVMVTHANVSRLFTSTKQWFDFGPTDAWTWFHSYAFDFSVWEIWGALLHGGRLVVAPYWVTRSPADFRDLLASEHVTVLNQTPSAFRQLLRADADAVHQPLALRYVIFGGEALDLQSLRPWFDRHGDARPQLINMYGITETTVHVTYRPLTRADVERAGSLIGRPIPDLQIYLLDKHLEPAPPGIGGEMFIGGEGLARGYLRREELTSQRFIANPFGDQSTSRLYRTGDLARQLTDGELQYLGRIDDQVKVRGFRIELGEIEAALLNHPGVEAAFVMAREDEPGDPRLVAYLKPDPSYEPPANGATAGDDPAAEHATQWRQVFDANYAETDATALLDFNITGWNSSYTGAPIAAEEMCEWVDVTVDRIRSLNPTDVLEIGCGTGLLLSRLAPHCKRYVGTDFSAVALRHVERLKAHSPNLGHVSLRQCVADDFAEVEPGSFDLVVLNSVAQYLPTLDCFLRVFDGAIQAVRPGGKLFFGDLRNLQLLRAHHTSVQLYQAADHVPAVKLTQRIDAAVAQEGELLLDPTLFLALRDAYPQIGDVRVLVKRGRHRNEMSLFRYDVIISVGGQSDAAERSWLEWSGVKPGTDAIRNVLRNEHPGVLAYAAVPNGRLRSERHALAWLEAADDRATVAELRRSRIDVPPGPDPEDIFHTAASEGYEVELSWASAHPQGHFDMLFYRGDRPRMAVPRSANWRTLTAYANDPLRRKLDLELIAATRRNLQRQLPAYMVPAAFVLVDQFPLTRNGKLNRSALPAPDAARRPSEKAFVAPRNAVEQTLADIWAHVLGLPQVGVQDNFFELGGDSILSIQIVSRAAQAGLTLSPRQVFMHQTIEDLATVAERSQGSAEADEAVGDVPLTPIQRWFFELDQPEPHHFNQALLLETSGSLQPEVLRQALLELPRRHAALRLRFSRYEATWRQACAEDDSGVVFAVVDWSRQSGEQRPGTLAAEAQRTQTGLDLTAGPLMRATLFHGAEGEPGRLLLVAHHLLIDGVSWRILLEELEIACGQLQRSEPMTVPPASVSWQRWSHRLNDYAQSSDLHAELDYWRNVVRATDNLLPGGGDIDPKDNTSAHASALSFQLSPSLTKALLHDVPPVYHTHINDILLTALVQTFADWTGRPTLLLDLEGHGREDLFAGMDVSRTVGWFTTLFPVRLALDAGNSPGEAIKTIKEQLRRVPRQGIGYGLLRYLAQDQPLRDASQPLLAFNYLGQFDGVLSGSQIFRPAPEPSGRSISPLHRRRHQIEINASITTGRLLMEWTYPRDRFGPDTIGQLGRTYLDRLTALIDHCRDSDAGGFTPSDFAGARVGQRNLDRLMSKLTRST